MRIVLLNPNFHSGGAELAGDWPPAWAAYISGALKQAEFDDIRFIDAMTNDLSDRQMRSTVGPPPSRSPAVGSVAGSVR